MSDIKRQIIEGRKKLSQLKKTYRDGKNIGKFSAFTVDISYEGNRETDIDRVVLGGVGDDENVGKMFYELAIKSLENHIEFWEKTAKREIEELHNVLAGKE